MSAKYTVLPLGELYALGHGDLFITAEDLARLGAIMAGCPGEGEAVALSEEYRLAMQTPQYERELAEGSYPNELCRGLGTQITDHLLPDRRMVGHQGNAYGSICGLFYDPETRTGFALLTNAHGTAQPSGSVPAQRTPPRRSMRFLWPGAGRTGL